ncbi:hypothetical protein KC973_02455 [Candidatus Saccharibacteria bacterium]|nr:hypothetical protein [Candidatus Saccharibacteria bacterium]
MLKKTQTANPARGQFYQQYQSKRSSKKTLYFIGPYTGRKFYFLPFFWVVQWLGYRIVYLQPVNAVLDSSQPQWLEQAIVQAQDVIYADRKEVQRDEDYLLGVSLGSYIGLNVILTERFKKFVVIAGGAPLADIFRTHYLFYSQRRKLRKNGGFEHIDAHWKKFDEAFKKHQLNGLRVLGFNSRADHMITQQRLQAFMDELIKAGAKIESRLTHFYPHEVQAFSTNWRMFAVDKFFKKTDM